MKVAGTAVLAALLWSATPFAASFAQTPDPDLSQPLTAEAAVRMALDRNFVVRLAEDRLGLEKAGRTAAYGEYVPSLSAGWDYRHAKSTVGQDQTSLFAPFPSETDDRGYWINAEHMLLNVASIYRISSAGKHVGAGEMVVETAEQAEAFNIKRQYYTLIEAIKLLEVRREDLRLAGEEQRRTESLFDVGSVARTDVLKARFRVAEAQSFLTTAENNTELERSRLAQLLALPVTAPLQVVEDLAPAPEVVDSSEAYDLAYENRPDLKAIRLRVEAASSDRKSAMARKLPFLSHSFNRSFGRATGDQRDFFLDPVDSSLVSEINYVKTTSSFWSYRIGFTWNILDGLVTEANVATARANQSLAEHEYEQLEVQVGLDVKDALLSLRSAQAQVLTSREGLVSAEEDLNLSQERYSVGLGTILELIDAQVAVTRARSAEVQAMAMVKIAEAQLDRATGRITW